VQKEKKIKNLIWHIPYFFGEILQIFPEKRIDKTSPYFNSNFSLVAF
jgi:hypothetical protein